MTYKWYRSDDQSYDAAADTEIGSGTVYTVTGGDVGKYLIVIATTPDIAGSGMAVSDDLVIAGQISAININTQAPVTGNELSNGTSTIDHATGPVVSWSADDGVNFTAANAGDKFSAPIAYQTKYVYAADANYRFDKDIENTVGTATSTITVTNLGTGSVTAAVSSISKTNDTLTITVTWPSTIATIDKTNKVTINTLAPVTGNSIAAGTNNLDHASNPVVSWSVDGGAFAAASAGDQFSGLHIYRSKYVYKADANYKFDINLTTDEIIITNGGTISDVEISSVASTNDTLTITVIWPKTTGILNSLTIDTPAPVNTNAIENGTNSIDSGSSLAVSWLKRASGRVTPSSK